MQVPTQNARTQGIHGAYNAVDYDNDPDPIIYAPEAGTVSIVRDNGTCGNSMYLQGNNGRHGFCHIDTYIVTSGSVVRGQPLARMGYTGYTEPDNVPAGAHLHWILLKNGVYVYPPSLVTEAFIKQGQGGTGVNVGNDNNWVGFGDRGMWAARGRHFGPSELPPFVGKDSHILSEAIWDPNNPEVKEHIENARIGKIARQDKWDQQIYALQDKVKALEAGQKLTVAEKDALKKQLADISNSLEAAYNN